MKSFLFSFLLLSQAALASDKNLCTQYQHNLTYTQALETLASRLSYDFLQMCSLPHLLDIYITDTILLDPQQNPIPHTWVTLHYSEHSCQYFLKTDDLSVTKKDCYNTW